MHSGGSSCAQAVFGVFAEDLGLDPKVAHKLAACLGAGLGRQQLLCGAISGGALALGLALGNEVGSDQVGKEATYEAVYDFTEDAKAEFGAANCRDLLEGLDLRDPAERAEYKARGLPGRVCERMIARCVELVEARLAVYLEPDL
jgi:C_GCAxxG_C_C family probable redox protein